MTDFPVWLGALLLAGAAPFLVRAYADAVERRHRQRTEAALAAGQLRDRRANPANQAARSSKPEG